LFKEIWLRSIKKEDAYAKFTFFTSPYHAIIGLMHEKKETADSFTIGNVSIPGRIILSPMDGYTDSPFRLICRQFGSAASYSEFINGIDLKHGHPYLKFKLSFSEPERPFIYQIFDDSPDRLLFSALELAKHKPNIIDINMGCSAKNVSSRGAGAGLLKDPIKIGHIINLLVKNLEIPITAKIRLGWDNASRNYLTVVKTLIDNGISGISVHGRTRKQEYNGAADWDAIGEIKHISTVPIIGSGDIQTHLDALEKLKTYSVDAVMIGRAAIGNPWVFENRTNPEINFTDRFSVISQHLSMMIGIYGERLGIKVFRKHLVRYLSGYLITREVRKEIFSIDSSDILLDYITTLTK
jgi:tRNA-dihydrouridine synthase B